MDWVLIALVALILIALSIRAFKLLSWVLVIGGFVVIVAAIPSRVKDAARSCPILECRAVIGSSCGADGLAQTAALNLIIAARR